MRKLKTGHISCDMVLPKFIIFNLSIHLLARLTGNVESSYRLISVLVVQGQGKDIKNKENLLQGDVMLT